MYGLFVKGLFCGHDLKSFVRQADGKLISYNQYLISNNSDFMKISSDNDYTKSLQFGDEVTFSVRPRVYKDSIYWYGDLVNEEL